MFFHLVTFRGQRKTLQVLPPRAQDSLVVPGLAIHKKVVLHSRGSHHFSLCWGCSPVLRRNRAVVPSDSGIQRSTKAPAVGLP